MRSASSRHGAPLIAAADASIARLAAGHDPEGRLLAGLARGSKGLSKCLELSGQCHGVAAMICVLDCPGRDEQIVHGASVCAF